MSESKGILLLDEALNSPLKLIESHETPSGEHTGAVLATLFGTLSDYGNETRNDRWYTGSLWRRVFNDELFQEALATKTLYGEADHPLDIENRLETHIPYVSHIVRDPKINEAKQVVEGFLDILDTPYGRIVKTLIDYGCELGVSSRGSGDLTYIDGKTTVDENTYSFVTWDIVARPSNKKSRVHEIDTINSAGKTAFESLREQIGFMRDSKDVKSLRLTESLISKTDIPDKDEVLKMIKESYESEFSSRTPEDDVVAKSDLDEAYDRIMELKSEISRLDNENKSLSKSLEDRETTISDLNELNKNLGSMVTSYMDKLSKANESNSEHTMMSENSAKGNSIIEEDEEDSKIDLTEITEMIEKSTRGLSSKMSEVLRKLNQCIDTEDSSEKVKELSESLNTATTRNSELERSLKNSQSENIRLIRKISSVVNEYFKVRCNQLGLNEQVAKKEFNNRLYEYDLKDIDDVLTELYSATSGSRRLTESLTQSSGQLGSVQLVGSVVPKNGTSITESSDELDDDMIGLMESIRQVKLG